MRQFHFFVRVPVMVVMDMREDRREATVAEAQEYVIGELAKQGFPRCTVLSSHMVDGEPCILRDWEPDAVELVRPV